MSDLIEQALEDATDTKAVLVAPAALDRVAELFGSLFPGRAAVVIGDERTMQIAGERVITTLEAAAIEVLEPLVLPAEPELYAKYENAEAIRDALAGLDATPVAVGAGTLNDLVKRASGELGRPYLVVGTAASMDGYTAFGSSIAVDGLKQTLICPAPAGVVADLDLMASAPQVMTASGYGDLLGKVPAGADWILADAVGQDLIDPSVWAKVQGPLRHSLARPEDLAAGQVDAIGDLTEGLMMSGLAMQAAASSRPASGAEHHFSHLWEMEGHGVDITPRRLSHGFKVGIGSVAIAALYQVVFTHDLAELDVEAAVAAWPTREAMEARVRAAHPDPVLQQQFVELSLAKYLDGEQLRARLQFLVEHWPELKARLVEQLLPPEELQRRLRAVGAPAHPAEIGLDWQRFRQTYTRAQMIRNRYTILDLLLEANLLEAMVEQLFAPDGFWGRQER